MVCPKRTRALRPQLILFACATVYGTPIALAQDASRPVDMSMMGTPGLVVMPDARQAPDARASFSVSHMRGMDTTTLTFQASKRLSASFRYSGVDGAINPDQGQSTYWDRSFDLRYKLLEEGRYLPALTVGLQDFAGTGLFSGEYIAATKTVTPRLAVTAGLGFGRLGSRNPITTIGDRPGVTEFLGEGGMFAVDRWFKGDVAPFGGVSWQATDKLKVNLEYSSDAYSAEKEAGIFAINSPWNASLEYDLGQLAQLGVYTLGGDEFGVQLTFGIDPKRPKIAGGRDEAPLPILRRPAHSAEDLGWTTQQDEVRDAALTVLDQAFEREGLAVTGLELSAHEATLRLHNPRFDSEPQAIGRAARTMANVLPESIETFHIIPEVNGLPVSRITLNRSDLENLQYKSARAINGKMQVTDAVGATPEPRADLYPDWRWGLAPYLALGYFDVEQPVRADIGIRLRGEYRLSERFRIQGAITHRLIGDLGDGETEEDPYLPAVRTDGSRYYRDPTGIQSLTLQYNGRPGKDLYSHLTFGYLETMYAGIAAEVLWKPVDSRLALGGEVAYVQQRDFDRMFGLRDYDVVTGHLSAYYDFGNGYHAQIDAGQYLAKDVGATLTLQRELNNGWIFGVFATKTNITSEEFGEGSFDKGFFMTLPLSYVMLEADRGTNSTMIRPLQRNGGARVTVPNRLYEQVRDYHRPTLDAEYGRFWR